MIRPDCVHKINPFFKIFDAKLLPHETEPTPGLWRNHFTQTPFEAINRLNWTYRCENSGPITYSTLKSELSKLIIALGADPGGLYNEYLVT